MQFYLKNRVTCSQLRTTCEYYTLIKKTVVFNVQKNSLSYKT